MYVLSTLLYEGKPLFSNFITRPDNSFKVFCCELISNLNDSFSFCKGSIWLIISERFVFVNILSTTFEIKSESSTKLPFDASSSVCVEFDTLDVFDPFSTLSTRFITPCNLMDSSFNSISL